jgi:catechol 2,3-dioxygenase-like lactoylglutathione lyase family enzyme
MHSVAVFVNNIDRAIEFYRDVLGLPIVKQGSFGAEFLEEPPHLGVHPAGHAEAKSLVGRHTGVTFYVPGLVHFCGELHAKGVRFINEPTQMAWGVMAMIADPEGNIFALWEDEIPESGPGAS